MSDKPAASLLNVAQIQKRVFDEKSGALRVNIGQDTEFAIALSADEGDSVQTVAKAIAVKQTVSGSGVAIAPMQCIGLSKFQLFVNGSGSFTVEMSPSDSDDVWMQVGDASKMIEAIGRRIRVKGIIAEGSSDIYLVGQA